MKISTVLGLLSTAALAAGCGGGSNLCDGIANCIAIDKGASEVKIKTAFAEAIDATTIVFGAGTFKLTAQLDVRKNGVTIKGAGRELTLLDFGGSAAGQDGIHVETTGAFTIEDLTVQDAAANGIKVLGAKGVTMRRVGGVWSKPAATTNGRYALYPVQSEDVLLEDSYAKGSSDAGIYVGQCKNVIVRRNKAEGNVAGLEIENTDSADVYENEVTGNTSGLMIFGLPGLPLRHNTSKIRVYKNKSIANNLGNFAEAGGIVSKMPGGFGALVMASSDVEFFQNQLDNHDSVSIAVVSYCIADSKYCEGTPADPLFDPFPRRVFIHDNTITNSGTKPGDHILQTPAGLNELATVLSNTFGMNGPVPNVLYDGLFAPPLGSDAKNPMSLCLKDNGTITFSNFDASTYDSNTISFPNAKSAANTDQATFTCTLPALTAVTIPGVT